MPVNVKNPAIKRIHADVRELMKDPSDQYHAAPLETNLFEWHFTIRGPPDTEFEGGVYHGRILLPPEYPFRPPDIVFNTPNGRFNVGTKICLTISSYHPEHWQPAWGIRLILEALISFFPSPSHGALGGLDWTPEERKKLAVLSGEWKCYKCGLASDLLPELRPKESGEGGAGGRSGGSNNYADQIRELHKLKAKTAEEVAAEASFSAKADGDAESGPATAAAAAAAAAHGAPGAGAAPAAPAAAAVAESEIPTALLEDTRTAAVDSANARGGGDGRSVPVVERRGDGSRESPSSAIVPDDLDYPVSGDAPDPVEGGAPKHEDEMLSFIAVAIVLAIFGILIRKGLRYLGT